jgi:hypothetical protein
MRRMSANAANDATAQSNPPRLSEATKPDLFTIAAITIVATVIADIIHEGLGHGGMCVATGGRALVLSTVHFDCSADTRLVAAGGTLANLIFGALFWIAERGVKRSASWRYFFWLLMTFNLLSAGGYFLFSGIGNIGDWADVVAGWQPAWAWRVGLAALGPLVATPAWRGCRTCSTVHAFPTANSRCPKSNAAGDGSSPPSSWR